LERINELHIGGLTYQIKWIDEAGSKLLHNDLLYDTDSYSNSITLHTHTPESFNISMLFSIAMFYWYRSITGDGDIDQPMIDRISTQVTALCSKYPDLLDTDNYNHYDTIQVADRIYEILLSPPGEMGDDGSFGTHSVMRGTIQIHIEACQNRQCHVRWHELIHAIDKVVNTDIDEPTTSLLGTCVCSILKQNPNLVEWIKSTYHCDVGEANAET